MRGTAKIAKLFGGDDLAEGSRRSIEDDIADLERRLAEVRAAGAAACSEVDGLEARLAEVDLAELGVTDFKRLEEELRDAKLNQRFFATTLPKVQAQLTAAKDARRRRDVPYHQRKIQTVAVKLRGCLEAAVAAQEEALRAFEDAAADVGTYADAYVPKVAFAGFLKPEFLEQWINFNRGVFAGQMPQPPEPVRIDPELRAAQLAAAERSEQSKRFVAPKVEKPATPAVKPRPAAPKPQRRIPDDFSPLAAGEVRCKVMSGSYHDHKGSACHRGQIIKLPSFIADRALGNGAVEWIDEEELQLVLSGKKGHAE